MSETRETMIRRAVVAMQESKAWPAVFRPETGRALAEAAVDAVAAPDLAEALEAATALLAASLADALEGDAVDMELTPDGSVKLSDCLAALARAKGAA